MLRGISQQLDKLGDQRSDIQKRVDAVKKAIKKKMNVWETLISVTADSPASYHDLEHSTPVFIVKMYRAKILQSG